MPKIAQIYVYKKQIEIIEPLWNPLYYYNYVLTTQVDSVKATKGHLKNKDLLFDLCFMFWTCRVLQKTSGGSDMGVSRQMSLYALFQELNNALSCSNHYFT